MQAGTHGDTLWSKSRDQFDILIQVVRGEALINSFAELMEQGARNVLIEFKFVSVRAGLTRLKILVTMAPLLVATRIHATSS